MNSNEILNKYIDLIDKGYCCDCNELNCIDNFPHSKITHAIKELQQENKILKENAENNDKVVDKVNWENMLLKKENKQLKDNWNKLRELILEEGFEINTREYGSLDVIDKNVILEKMQELEQGSDK